jgi:hypothetical protein
MNTKTLLISMTLAPAALAASFADVRVAFDPAGPYQSTIAANPGSTLYFEVRLRTDSPTHLGLAGATYQLQVDGWHPTNTLLPWSTPRTSSGEGGPGVHGAAAFGRLAPFAAADAASTPVTSLVNNTLTIGGTGPSGAIATSQLPQLLSTNSFGPYFSTASDAAVFRFAFVVGFGSDVLQLTVTPTAFTNGVVRWYDSPSGASSTNEDLPSSAISPASVFFIPAPGMTTLAALACLAFRRARRE